MSLAVLGKFYYFRDLLPSTTVEGNEIPQYHILCERALSKAATEQLYVMSCCMSARVYTTLPLLTLKADSHSGKLIPNLADGFFLLIPFPFLPRWRS